MSLKNSNKEIQNTKTLRLLRSHIMASSFNEKNLNLTLKPDTFKTFRCTHHINAIDQPQ